MRIFVFIWISFFLSPTVFPQSATGNIEIYMGNIIDNLPGSSGDDYNEPDASQINTWNTVINSLLAGNLVEARADADKINYQITEFTDISITPNQVFYVLEEKSAQSNYWGTFVFSKTPNRNNLIIQAPHSIYDTNTGKQAVYCFKNTVARAVFINGTHRCNSNTFSSCSGTTGVCGSTGPYRISDMAHVTTSIFQKTTEILFTSIANSVFVQLHGFAKKTSDPYVIMSNGTRETPVTDYASLIKEALLEEDNTLTFKLAHIDTGWDRLIAFTNTQGRLINNSSDYCNQSATTTSGRFIHIEQEKSKLRADENAWVKMSNALATVFSVTLSTDDFKLDNIITVFPNPTHGRVYINGQQIDQIEVYNAFGQKIMVKKDRVNFIDFNNKSCGLYFLKITAKQKVFTKKVIRLY